ncbi:MAG: LTA synthase family protein [Candidatus Accumulibacter sp.]|uniref:LTA synthase family protein n=1 Tax=Accumulibacter sp. TaxID=2053492 RepID=UPI001A48E9C0|nr:LTA synthase family protein [Accumulibacter sp.]MBL8396342.1 LTA synthase family protein [Accumulibacter sp.]
MAESFCSAAAGAAVGGAAVSLLIERFLRPFPTDFWRRPLAALVIHLGLWFLLFSCLLLVLQRPFFAAGALLAGLLFVVLVSNAKFASLREPFIFQDFEYFSDALKHPRLYLPFLGAGRAGLAVLAFAGAVAAGLAVEEPLSGRLPVADFLVGAAILALLGLSLLWLGARCRPAVSFDATADLQRLGLVATMWRYGEEELVDCAVVSPYRDLTPERSMAERNRRLVVVQSESFFDPRHLIPEIRRDVLRGFDAVRADAVVSGQLAVAAWGANTVRTEFAFLSGLAAGSLAVHRFNPYRRLARRTELTTLVSFLKSCGYRTVCVHPYAASFYARDKVYPHLGFDEFVDIRSFDGAARSGPYVSDLAVAERVAGLLRGSLEQPLFVFVITMENHGPLHLETVLPGDCERYYSTPPGVGCAELTVYLRHLANADRMAGRLRDELEALPGTGWLCWFGDHVPIMPEVYRRLGTPAGHTDYFVWRKGGQNSPTRRRDLSVSDLGCLLLQEMGVCSSATSHVDMPDKEYPPA